MAIVDSCSTMKMICLWWQCIGNTDSITWSADTMYLPGADAEHYASCVLTYLLFQYGKIGNESKDVTVPHGAFGYIGHNECVHAYRIR